MKVLLHQFPPVRWNEPEIGLMNICSALRRRGHAVRIVYWNIILRRCYEQEYEKLGIGFLGNLYKRGEILYDIALLWPFIGIGNRSRITAWAKHVKLMDCDGYSEIVRLGISKIRQVEDSLIMRIRKTVEEEIVKNCQGYEVWGLPIKFYQWIAGKALLGMRTKEEPECVVVLGGSRDRAEAEMFLKLVEEADYSIWGEGEVPFLGLLEKVTCRNNAEISGVVGRERGSEDCVGLNVSEDLPTIDYSDYFEAIEIAERDEAEKSRRRISYSSTRGCTWHLCRFCNLHGGYSARSRGLDEVMDDIEMLERRHHIMNLHFADQDIKSIGGKGLDELLSRMIEYRSEKMSRLRYSGDVTPDGIDWNTMKRIRAAGFSRLLYGLEALDDELLEKYRKRHRMVDNLLFAKMAHRAGMPTIGNIIVGGPDETVGTVERTIRNILTFRFFPLGGTNYCRLESLRIDYGSEMVIEQLKKKDNLEIVYDPVGSLMQLEDIEGVEKYLTVRVSNRDTRELWKKVIEEMDNVMKAGYRYSIKERNGEYLYTEYRNGAGTVEVELKPVEMKVLWEGNSNIADVNEMRSKLGVSEGKMIAILNKLRGLGIVYLDRDDRKMVTLIDLDVA